MVLLHLCSHTTLTDLVEVVEGNRGNRPSDFGRDRLAHVTDEVGNAKQLGRLLLTADFFNVEVPANIERNEKEVVW